jgi:hypothetical protein
MRNMILAAALLAACGSATEPTSEPLTPHAEFSVPGTLAEPTLSAVDLWRRSGYETPDVVIGAHSTDWKLMLHAGIIRRCGVERAIGCTERPMFPGDTTLIFISTEVKPEEVVSVIAHEVGHALGFADGDGAVMNPGRPLDGPVCTPAGDCTDTISQN